MRLTRLLFSACYLIRNRQADKMTLKHELELKEKKLLLYEEMLKAGYGKEEITRKTGISRPTSASSIGRALRRMTDLGQAVPVSVLRCRKERKRMRKFAPGGTRRLRKGDRPQVEIDHTIIFVRDTVFRVFVAYGRDSRVCVMRAYLNATSGNAARFMEHVCMEWPHRSLKDKNGLLLALADYMRLKQSHML